MDDLRRRVTVIGHAGMALMNPLPAWRLDEALAHLPLDAGSRILDLGCGKAEALCRIAERYAAHGTGVELSPHFAEEARLRAAAMRRGTVTIVEGDALAFRGGDPFDLVVILGPGWPHEGFADLVRLGQRHLVPNGHLLVADAYWRRPPTDAFLALLGARREEMPTSDELAVGLETAGLETAWSATVSTEEFDRYESAYLGNLRAWISEHPGDPLAADVATWARHVEERHRSGGREQLGFAAYLLRVPD